MSRLPRFRAAAPALTAALALVAVAPAARAVTYQVGPTRTNRDLASVAGRLNPGDIVEVDGGVTYTGGVVLARPGTRALPITIRGVRVGGARPVLAGGTNSIELQGDHYVLEAFDVTGGTSRCIYHHADDITIRDTVVHDCPQHGILGADTDSGSLTLEYSEVHHCGEGTQHHSIYMATDEAAHPGSVFRMQFNYVHDCNGGNAVKSRAERNEIYYNWIEGALYHELELIGPDPSVASDLPREDSDVVGNVLRKTNTFYVARFGGDGTGETGGRYRFVNNTVIVMGGGSDVFRLFDGLQSVEMHNNVFFAPSGAVNVMRTTEAVWTSGSEVVAGSNNWLSTGAAHVPTEWTGTVTGAAPGFAALASYDLHPAAGSPLINAGNNTTAGPASYPFPRPLTLPMFEPPARAVGAPGSARARPTVGAVDIGAYEFGTGTPTDAGVADAALPDAALPDAALPDVMVMDAAMDAGARDVAVPPTDVARIDAARTDVAARDAAADIGTTADTSTAPDVPAGSDVVTGTDSARVDVATAGDAATGAEPVDDGGTGARTSSCACRASGPRRTPGGALALVALGLVARSRRARRRR